MTAALVGVIAALAALAGVLGGGLIWALKRMTAAHDARIEALGAGHQAAGELRDANQAVAAHALTIRSIRNQLDREISARKTVEENLAKAITELAETGEPARVAGALRADLERLRALSKEMPDVPDVPDADDG
jgi:hypothetical protein